jgi:hypothetical protein
MIPGSLSFIDMVLLLMCLISIYRATKWHNLNNRGCKPTVVNKLNVTALKGLNIRLAEWVHYSTPLGLAEGFLVFTVGCTYGYSNKTPLGLTHHFKSKNQ